MNCFLPGLILLSSVSLAQPPFQIRHLTINDGLSQGSCWYIHKDSRGFVWASSQDGLNRFDGTRFMSYHFDERDTTTIGKGEVRGIVETPTGDLWVGTEECLNQYNRRSNRFRRYYVGGAANQPKITTHEPFWADDSTVWYVNKQEGFVKLNYRTGHKTVLYAGFKPRFSLNTEWVVHQPDQHAFVFLLPVGFARYDYQTHQLTTFLTGLSTDVLPGRRLFQCVHLCQRRNGAVCLAGPQGIDEFDARLTGIQQHHALRPNMDQYRLMSLAEDARGRWWIGAEGSGVWLYDPDSRQLLHQIKPGLVKASSLLTTQISKVYVDDLGLVWANADPFGIELIFPGVFRIETLPDNPTDDTDLNNHPIRGLCEDRRGHIWIGTVDGGIRRFDPATGRMRAYRAEQGVTKEGNVRQIYQTKNGRLLVCNLQGLLRYNPTRDRFESIVNPLCANADCGYARGICELPDGRFVMATYEGLFMLDERLQVVQQIDSTGTYFGSLYFDQTTNLLYAGRRDQDLIVYRYEKGLLNQAYVTLPGYNILSFFTDSALHCLWICTDRGLVQFNPVNRRVMRTYTSRDGLPNDIIYGLLPDKQGRFWLSTNNGLVKFSPPDKKFSSVMMTKAREYNSGASLIGSDGVFYMGGVHGLDRFVPDKLDYKAKVPVRIVDFLVNDKPYHTDNFPGETGQVTLSYQERTFSVGFTTLDYLSDGHTKFFYQLSGVDRGWVELNNASSVRYPDVSPGDYTFQVQAVDARGQLTPITRLQVSIQPPFYRRWWFILLGLISLISLVAFGVSTYNRQKLTRQRRLLRNTLATQENERRRIARDLHDDVGNTLATAKGMLGMARERDAGAGLLPEVIRAYDLIDKANKDLRMITHDLMPVEFDSYSLPDVIGQLVERANQSSHTEFEFILFGTVRRLKPERELVTYRIIAELIQNALKHAGPGLAIVQLGYYDRQLNVLVETPVSPADSDLFFSEQMTPGIGQKNITYRAEYLQAALITDKNAQIYTVMLDVPYDETGYVSY